MARRTVRRLIVDLTPLVDVIMILLFGVMIDSVERADTVERDARNRTRQAAEMTESSRLEQSRLESELEGARARLSLSQREREELIRQLERQKWTLALALAKLLQMDDQESLRFRQRLEHLSPASAQHLETVLAELRRDRTPAEVYQALHRIEEMQKVFTFVDLHVDADNFLSVVIHRQQQARFSVREAQPRTIEIELRDVIEDLSPNQILLLLFSYDDDAFIAAVERTEEAIRSLAVYYRGGTPPRQVRFGKVGVVPEPPAGEGG